MTSYYSQIQYVPDPVSGERMNIGVVALDESGCKFLFVRDWRRAAAFGGREVGFLRQFAEEAKNLGSSWFSVAGPLGPSTTARNMGKWHNMIQFSDLRPSVKNRDELLESMAALFLRDFNAEGDAAPLLVGRGRDRAVSNATKVLGAALRRRFGHAPRGLLQRDVALKGQIESHELHVAVKNGELYGGAFAVSFETGSPRTQRRDTDAIAFALEDISRERNRISLSVVVIPPRDSTPTYSRAKHIFKELETPIVTENGLLKWAQLLVDELPEEVATAHA